jgi:hypothetical protein
MWEFGDNAKFEVNVKSIFKREEVQEEKGERKRVCVLVEWKPKRERAFGLALVFDCFFCFVLSLGLLRLLAV